MKKLNYDENTGEILGFYDSDIHISIPKPNIEISEEDWQDYINNQGLRIVDLNTLIVVEYSPPEPVKTSKQLRDEALANIAWVRPSDEVVVQIRHPKFAPDIQVMEGAISRLEDGESRSWIDVEDNPITMSKEDMLECVEHGYNEIDRIYTEEYIPTL